MRYPRFYPCAATLGLLLPAAACRPDAPTTHEKPVAAAPAPARPAALAANFDTLHLPGGQVLQLRPTSATAFNQLPVSSLPDLINDPAAEHLDAPQGRVRRQGLDLLLRPAQGNEVRLSSTPDAEFTLQNGKGVKYMYWGSLPAAHQWVVRAWYWESAGTVLVDQRTGRHVEVLGDPTASPDGRYLLLTSPGLGGGDQPNTLGLAQIDTTGPRLLWQREPSAWEPTRARWAGPRRVLLQLNRADAEGQVPESPRPEYLEATLP